MNTNDEDDGESPRHKSASYRPCVLCNPPVHCGNGWCNTESDPCWGQVMIVDGFDTGDYAHACEGHGTFPYQPEPKSEEPT